MNKDTNKRGRGRPPKRRGRDLGRNTYIQEIISRTESGSLLRDFVRVRSHTRSGGQSSFTTKVLPNKRSEI